ncbi:ATP synthase subunit G atp20 [Taxawa tesnikishii (nom. ined.)]|nr:ATP synthase subunit G atp20 [Dothideales sp. JES 119]
MSFAVSRALIRRSNFALRRAQFRNASTNTEAAKESASNMTSKASEGLSRVSSSAGSGMARASNAMSSMGGRVGRMVNFVQSLIPPTIYYARVGLELGKLVAQGQKMSPPSMSQFQSYMQPMMNAMRNPASIMNRTADNAAPSQVMGRLRNFDNAQMAAAAVAVAEAIGFFTVGEMIGRMKLIGYHTSEPAPDAQVHH